MKLLIVSSEYPPIQAGIANLACSVYTEFRKRGDDVYLFAPEGSDISEPERQFPLYRRPASGGFQWHHHIRNSLAIRWIINGKGMERLLFMDASARCFPFPWVPRIPAALYLNGSELIPRSFPGELASGRFFLQSRALARAQSVLCISEATRMLLQSRFPNRTASVVYPGFDKKRIYHPEKHAVNPFEEWKDRLIFLTVARIAPRKGHDRVLEILARIQSRLPPFQYCIVGQGPEEARLKALAKSLGISDRVVFSGSVSDEQLGAYYHHADLFIMLSRPDPEGVEGFGLTYVEASASGTAVVGSDSGGAVEAVKPGVSGLTVPSENIPFAAEEILALALDDPRRRQLAETGEQWARENFSGAELYARFKSFVSS